MYGKFFSSTFTGSMVGSGLNVFAVWGYVIANTSADGHVEINPPIVAAILGCEVKEVESAIKTLCAVDEKSRSKKEDGRRLVQRAAFLYFVPTYTDYRAIRDNESRREYMRNYMRNYRGGEPVKQDVNIGKSQLAHTDADTEEEANTKNKGIVGLKPGTKALRMEATALLTFLNEKTKRCYQPVDANIDMIVARLKEGNTPEDCRAVIAKKCRQWGTDEKMSEYLRPATLFGRTKFAQYRGEIGNG